MDHYHYVLPWIKEKQDTMRNLMMKRIEEYAGNLLAEYLADFNVSRLDLLSNSELIDLFEILIEETE